MTSDEVKTRCPKCGTEFDDSVVFCGECGTRVVLEENEAPAARSAVSTSTRTSAGQGAPSATKQAAPASTATRQFVSSAVPAIPKPTTTGAAPASSRAVRPSAPAPRPSSPPSGSIKGRGPLSSPGTSLKATAARIAQAAANGVKPPQTKVEGPPTQTQATIPDAQAKPQFTSLHSGWTLPPAPAPGKADFTALDPDWAAQLAPPSAQVPTKREEPVPPPGVKAPDSRPPSRRKSGRPAAPGIAEWGANTEDKQSLFDEVDAGFFNLVKPPAGGQEDLAKGPAQAVKGTAADAAAVIDMFQQIAPLHATPLRDFMIECGWGDPDKSWLSVCLPAAKSLKTAADKMDLSDLRSALDDFVTAVEVAETTEGARVYGDAKDLLWTTYERLIKVMPNVFALDAERGRREPVIVHALLMQVPGMGKVGLDKIYAAGLTRLDMFYAAKPDEVAAATGLALELTSKICDRFQAYKAEREASPHDQHQADRHKLETLAVELRAVNREFKQVSGAWSATASTDKQRLRNARARLFLEIQVVLARMGEVELISALERVPFEQKPADLEKYLHDTSTKARSNS